MFKFGKLLFLSGLLLVGTILSSDVSKAATSIQSINFDIEINEVVFGGVEPILLTGTVHHNAQFTTNDNKSLIVLHSNAKGVTGIGLISGEKYEGVGSTICIINDNLQSFETTYVDNFNLVGKGKAADYKLHINYHLTQNANGVWTAFVENINIH